MSSTWLQRTFSLKSRKAGCYLITDQVMDHIGPQLKQIQIGLCHLFLPHTSAGISLGQNCDPTVRQDMKQAFSKLAPEGKMYKHDYQGPDDMPAHIKSCISGVSLSIPISKGSLLLGTWQGIWLMEYRTASHTRNMTATIQGSTSQAE